MVKRQSAYIDTGCKNDILLKESWFDDEEIKAYREFLSKDAKEINASIRLVTSAGRVLGSEGFIKELKKFLKRDLFPQRLGVLRKKARNTGSVPYILMVELKAVIDLEDVHLAQAMN